MIEDYGTYLILKGYLDGKRVRILIAKQESRYIPLALYKKESKEGFNIRFDFNAYSLIQKIERSIKNNEFEIFEL